MHSQHYDIAGSSIGQCLQHRQCHNDCPASSPAYTVRASLCVQGCAALQADLFEYLCLEGQQHQRDVELNALQPMVGSDPLTPPQLTRMQEARQQHQDQAAAAQRQADTLRQVVKLLRPLLLFVGALSFVLHFSLSFTSFFLVYLLSFGYSNFIRRPFCGSQQ